MTKYIALDIETTGLDPNTDMILEIAWCITDDHFQPIMAPRSYVIEHSILDDANITELLLSNDVVRNMHEQSGLLADIANRVTPKASLHEVTIRIADDIEMYQETAEETFHLAGFSIAFDKSFLMESPLGMLFDSFTLSVQIHHRMVDLSSIKLLWQAYGIPIPEVENPGKHRAVNDVREVIAFGQKVGEQLALTAGMVLN